MGRIADCNELNFPKSLRYNYIGVKQPEIKYNKVSEQLARASKADYIEGGD